LTIDDLFGACEPFVLGKAQRLRKGVDGVLLAYGSVVREAMKAADSSAEGMEDDISRATANTLRDFPIRRA